MPPVIHQVVQQDSSIRVHATDNIQVSKVLITISDEQGQTLEQAEAAFTLNNVWEHRPASPTTGTLMVEAFDLAGNVARHKA